MCDLPDPTDQSTPRPLQDVLAKWKSSKVAVEPQSGEPKPAWDRPADASSAEGKQARQDAQDWPRHPEGWWSGSLRSGHIGTRKRSLCTEQRGAAFIHRQRDSKGRCVVLLPSQRDFIAR